VHTHNYTRSLLLRPYILDTRWKILHLGRENFSTEENTLEVQFDEICTSTYTITHDPYNLGLIYVYCILQKLRWKILGNFCNLINIVLRKILLEVQLDEI